MNEPKQKQKKKRVDGQVRGLAGDFLEAGELPKRNLETSNTFETANTIDIFARYEAPGSPHAVQA